MILIFWPKFVFGGWGCFSEAAGDMFSSGAAKPLDVCRKGKSGLIAI